MPWDLSIVCGILEYMICFNPIIKIVFFLSYLCAIAKGQTLRWPCPQTCRCQARSLAVNIKAVYLVDVISGVALVAVKVGQRRHNILSGRVKVFCRFILVMTNMDSLLG